MIAKLIGEVRQHDIEKQRPGDDGANSCRSPPEQQRTAKDLQQTCRLLVIRMSEAVGQVVELPLQVIAVVGMQVGLSSAWGN